MDLAEFREDFQHRVVAHAAAESDFTHSSFVDVAVEYLEDAGEVADFEQCYFRGQSGRFRRNIAIDGYAFDKADGSLRVFIAEPTFSVDSTLTQTDSKIVFDRLRAFVEDALEAKLDEILDENSPARSLSEQIYAERLEISRIRAYLISDSAISARIKDWPEGQVGEIPFEYHIWDITRIFRVFSSASGRDEQILISFRDGNEIGIPCLEASNLDNPYTSYLCVVPGEALADIYDEFGSRLLEGNVRAFLTTKGRINRGIKTTVLSNPEMFFAYNNGIAATASSATIEKGPNGLRLNSATDLQIVNGGQTTASLANARKVDKASLKRIYVPMKLTVVGAEASAELIPKISKFANSQNKVSEADFFSNHEFHRRLEQLSRRIWAPAKPASQHETHWFYERARGQFFNEKNIRTESKKRLFLTENPQEQVFVKTDLAKSELSWLQAPHRVSRGAQSAFMDFADQISKQWVKDETVFNESYFRNAVVRLLVFRATEKIVTKQTWYQNGYRANIVTYAIAKLSNQIAKAGRLSFDFQQAWNRQSISESTSAQLAEVARIVFAIITNPASGQQNVTQWCKREECWESVKAIEFQLLPEFQLELVSAQEIDADTRAAKAQQVIDSGIDAQTIVVNMGHEFWKQVLSWVRANNLAPPSDERLLRIASGELTGLASDRDSKRLLQLVKKLESDGFVVQGGIVAGHSP